MVFADYEVPVAHSMVKIAAPLRGPVAQPLYAFTCYWAAFNNIYVTIADQLGKGAQLRKNPDGSLRTRTVGQVSIPEVKAPTEREQINLAFRQFTDELKRGLIEHQSTRFFVYRTPQWRGRPVEHDVNGQRLNGVLNVGHTVDAMHPVWAPIDNQGFEQYHHGAHDVALRDELARQVLNVLYTVRNNTFHGGKRADDANDQEVLERALPLLAMVVKSFMQVREAA